MNEERNALLENAEETTSEATRSDSTTSQKDKPLSVARQRGMLFIILSLQGLALCESTTVFPFFPAVAKVKGLSALQMGIVFSSYSVARSIFSPICGSIVSITFFLVAVCC